MGDLDSSFPFLYPLPIALLAASPKAIGSIVGWGTDVGESERIEGQACRLPWPDQGCEIRLEMTDAKKLVRRCLFKKS